MAKPSPTHNGATELLALGSAIRKIRGIQGLSQEALANQAGIDRSYMGGIERGEHNITLMNILRISAVLGVPASELLKIAKI